MAGFKQTIKTLRRELCEKVGITKYSKPALNNLDEKLQKYLPNRPGFFIEAGANDGFSQSNTYFLERFKEWTGVLVEPLYDLFVECKKNRPNSHVYNCALVSNDFKGNYVEMYDAKLMASVCGSLSEKDHEIHNNYAKSEQNLSVINKVKVKTRTLESILNELSVEEVDFFSLDVEGYELQVLKGLNLDKFKPGLLLIESRNPDEVSKLLGAEYELLEPLTHHDFLYRNKKR